MPTGYTAGIEDGTIATFREYALTCARAFGALIEMRDHSLDAPIPDELKPDSYYVKSVQSAEVELGKLIAMSEAEADAAARERHEAAIKYHDEYLAKNKLERERYAAMRAKVEAWTPPSPEHVRMKEFMLQQIEISLPLSDYSPTVEPLLSGAEWRFQRIARATESLERARKSLHEEEERVRGRNKWLRQLRESLEQCK
jgi:hypothetical protein